MAQQAATGGWRFWIDPGNTSPHLLSAPAHSCSPSPIPNQATLLVYQALAEFWTSYKGPEYDLNVDILLPGRSKPDLYNFNRESRFTTRTSKVRKIPFVYHLRRVSHGFRWSLLVFSGHVQMKQMKNINQNVKVTATGKGEAVLKVSLSICPWAQFQTLNASLLK